MSPWHILKTALRSLRWDFKNTIVNITGLTGGLVVFILIVLFVLTQYSYNSHIPHSDELFRYERGFHGITNALEADPIAGRIPEISGFCRITFRPGTLFYRPEGSYSSRADINAVLADPSFIDMFAVGIVERTAHSLLRTPASVLISRDLAENLFGKGHGPGEIISFENRHDLLVEGIFESLPSTSAFDFDIIMSLDYLAMESGNPHYLENPGTWMYETYFRLDPSRRDIVTGKLPDDIRGLYSGTDVSSFHETPEVLLRPMKEIYFSEVYGHHKLGDKSNTLIFMIIAGFVLIIAIINFINLSTARTIRRSKETGLRKIFGSGRTSLVIQLCTEGALTIMASILLALTISELLLPWYSGFVNISLSVDYKAFQTLALMVLLPLVLGVLAGLFPAYYMSRVSPLVILKKDLVTGPRGKGLRTFLTVFQFTISIFLITGTLVVNKQLRFANSYDPGYATGNIIEVKLNDQISGRFDVFKQKVLSHPSVKGMTRTNQPLYQAGNVWTVLHGEKNFTWPILHVDEDFVQVFGLNILTGHDFSDDMLQRGQWVFLVNEAVARDFETSDILDETINGHEIVGMVNDFHTASLKSDIRPVTIALNPSGAGRFTYIAAGQEGLNIIRDTWDQFSPDYPFEFSTLEEKLENAYISEKKFSELFIYFSLASILISCLGLFALASYTTETRIREISLRKIHGATTSGISVLLASKLTTIVLAANLFAFPATWFFIRSWLDNFAYRISPGPGEFILAAIIALIIALVTVSWHVYSTASKNPARVLRHE